MNVLQVEFAKLHKIVNEVVHARVTSVTEVCVEMRYNKSSYYTNVWVWNGTDLLASALGVEATSYKRVKTEVARLLKINK
jgi:hypothetical protein